MGACRRQIVAFVGLAQGRCSDGGWATGSLADLIGSGTMAPEKELSSKEKTRAIDSKRMP